MGLELVGKTINAPEFGELGRVADVSAKGNYAYLTMFYEPSCGRGGVQIVDIGDPAEPVKKSASCRATWTRSRARARRS